MVMKARLVLMGGESCWSPRGSLSLCDFASLLRDALTGNEARSLQPFVHPHIVSPRPTLS